MSAVIFSPPSSNGTILNSDPGFFLGPATTAMWSSPPMPSMPTVICPGAALAASTISSSVVHLPVLEAAMRPRKPVDAPQRLEAVLVIRRLLLGIEVRQGGREGGVADRVSVGRRACQLRDARPGRRRPACFSTMTFVPSSSSTKGIETADQVQVCRNPPALRGTMKVMGSLPGTAPVIGSGSIASTE